MHSIPTTGDAPHPTPKPIFRRRQEQRAQGVPEPPFPHHRRRRDGPPRRPQGHPTLPMPALNLEKKIPVPGACKAKCRQAHRPAALGTVGTSGRRTFEPTCTAACLRAPAPRGAGHQGALRTLPFVRHQPVAVTAVQGQFPHLKGELAAAGGLYRQLLDSLHDPHKHGRHVAAASAYVKVSYRGGYDTAVGRALTTALGSPVTVTCLEVYRPQNTTIREGKGNKQVVEE
jgi:hypothetical protein